MNPTDRDLYTLTHLIAIIQSEQPTLTESELHRRALLLRREHYRLKQSWHRSQCLWRKYTELSGLHYEKDRPTRDWGS